MVATVKSSTNAAKRLQDRQNHLEILSLPPGKLPLSPLLPTMAANIAAERGRREIVSHTI